VHEAATLEASIRLGLAAAAAAVELAHMLAATNALVKNFEFIVIEASSAVGRAEYRQGRTVS
jgi:hypothetical protein